MEMRDVIKGVRNPDLAAWGINNTFSNHIHPIFREPADFFDEDWDNLILLDGCRHDLLTEDDVPRSRYETRWSGGADSEEFLQYYVGGRTLNDVVWVTANPFVSNYHDSIFKVIDVWDDGWDDDLGTVLPETVAKAAQEAIKNYPNKRLVVHFMQPHFPFIGEKGQQLPEHRGIRGDGRTSNDSRDSIWGLLDSGEVSKREVWEAYRENLELVLPIAKGLVDGLDGESVISADHGNAFGERSFPIPIRVYGHQKGHSISELKKVPWVTFPEASRREIVGEPIEASETADSDVESRLKHLGYKV